MTDLSNLSLVDGVVLDSWFIPTTFISIELDNSFVLWSRPDVEYYFDTTNNLLKIRHFQKIRRSFPLNISVEDGKIYLRRNRQGNYFKGNNAPGFRLPEVGDLLRVDTYDYLITSIEKIGEEYEIEISLLNHFLSNFNNNAIFLDGTYSGPIYLDKGNYYSKHYKTNNVADIYISGEDIVSIAGIYI